MYRSKIDLYNIDCLPFMKQCNDNQFDLAIIDPPYGMVGNKYCTVNKKFVKNGFKVAQIDTGGETGFSLGDRPGMDYFKELFRISKNYIVWGGQYFSNIIPPNQCVIIWDKKMGEGVRFSDAEIALTSFNTRTDIFRHNTIHCNSKIGGRVHPTEKPIELYKWILHRYAEKGQTIFDSHLGSGSIAIACDEFGFDLTACEANKRYYDDAIKRLNFCRNQKTLF